MTDRPYAHRVARSIAKLNKVKPDWRQKVDAEKLQISSTTKCILGQVFGNYDSGCDALGFYCGTDPYCFSLTESFDSIQWDYLNIEWKRQLQTQYLTIELLLPELAKVIKNGQLQAQQSDLNGRCLYRSGNKGKIKCAIGAGLFKTPRFDPAINSLSLETYLIRGVIQCPPDEKEELIELQSLHDKWVHGKYGNKPQSEINRRRTAFYKHLHALRKKYTPFVV